MRNGGRGPTALGRSVLVRADQETPHEWSGCRRISNADLVAALSTADATHPITLDLHRSWTRRESLVIEANETPTLEGRSAGDRFWQLEPTDELVGERAWFFASANAVDMRGPVPRFGHLETLQLHGSESIGTHVDQHADPEVDGWLDGGPLEWLADVGRVIPRLHVVQKNLSALRPLGAIPTSLDNGQLAAVAHGRGAARIIAPAGSGKTRVLTERLRFLVQSGLSPRAVTLVAYNVRAQEEMQNRLLDISGVQVQTLHSLANRVCHVAEKASRRMTVLDEREVRRHLQPLVPKLARRANQDPLEAWVDAVNTCRDRLMDPSEVESLFDDVTDLESVVVAYRQQLRAQSATDFSEMVLRACEYLLAEPAFLQEMRATVGMLLVDEFQDLSPSLMLLTRLLAGPPQEVFCVGDDDQTIYGFSGATPRWLVDFAGMFPGAHTYFLTTNYRCPHGVVTAVDHLLRHNRLREPKTIKAAPEAGTNGLAIREPDGRDTAYNSMVDEVQALLKDGEPASDVVVLARTNADLIAPYIFLSSRGVRVQPPIGLDSKLMTRNGIESLMAWLGLATSEQLTPASIELSLRRPRRHTTDAVTQILVGKETVGRIRQFVAQNSNPKMRASLMGWCDHIEAARSIVARGGRTREVIDYLLDAVGIGAVLDELDTSQRAPRRATHRDQLEAIRAVATLEPDASKFNHFLREHLSSDNLKRKVSGDAVTLETVHRVKGLEWRFVHVVGVTDGSFPHRLSNDIEEERRLLHVAITRASQKATIWTALPPSPFIQELLGSASATAANLSAIGPQQSAARGATPASKKSPKKSQKLTADDNVDEELFETLRTWRLAVSRELGLAAFIVASDVTLRAISSHKPLTHSDLLAIKGIGKATAARWGDQILDLVRRHLSGNGN